MMLVKGTGEMALLPAVTAVLLNYCAMGAWTESGPFNTRHRGNCGSA